MTSDARPTTRTDERPRTDSPPAWHVVLLDDDDHTYDYVMRMLGELFAHPPERAFRLAQHVDEHGRVIVMTTHKELAELKRDQILGFGPDPLLARSAGAMSAVIEPAESEP